MFKFWKKKEDEKLPEVKDVELSALEKSAEKDKIDILLLNLEKLDVRLQTLNERIERLEKMVEEIYKIAKS